MASVFNPNPAPVGIDKGQIVGGGEHADVTLSALVRGHLAAGRLIESAPKARSTTKKES